MRLFIGACPPAAALVRIQSLCAASPLHGVDGVRWLAPPDLHLTLCFLGAVAPPRVAESLRCMAAATTGQCELETNLTDWCWLPGRARPRVLALHADAGHELVQLQRRLHERLVEAGFKLEMRRFRPHLTVARLRRGIDAPGMARFDPVALRVDRVVLFASETAPSGAKYRRLHEVGLDSPPPVTN